MFNFGESAWVAIIFIFFALAVSITAIVKYKTVGEAARIMTPLVTLLSVICTFFFTNRVADRRIAEADRKTAAIEQSKQSALADAERRVAAAETARLTAETRVAKAEREKDAVPFVASNHELKWKKDPADLFKKLDTTGDGGLSLEEFTARHGTPAPARTPTPVTSSPPPTPRPHASPPIAFPTPIPAGSGKAPKS